MGMQLSNEFVVAARPERTWDLLTDLERVAPCMPGASLSGRDGDDYVGTVKIKVGPIGASFAGKARFLDQDDAAHTATISMAGKDAKGAASVNATIRARLEEVSADSTRVYVDTDLDISGRMAQFGRGAIADVSNRLIGQFTTNLGALIAAPDSTASSPSATPGASAGTTGTAPATGGGAAPFVPPAGDQGLDAWGLVGPAVLKQVGVPLLAFAFGWLVSRAFPGRRR